MIVLFSHLNLVKRSLGFFPGIRATRRTGLVESLWVDRAVESLMIEEMKGLVTVNGFRI